MYSIKATNASFGNVGVKLTFSADSETESGYDKINIYVQNPSKTGYYTKTLSGSIGGTTVLIPTSTFYINFNTDGSVTKNGFKILPLELTTYSESDGYKDFNTSSYTTISPSSVTTISGINNTVETAHPYSSNFNQWWFWDTQLTIGNTTVTNEYYIYRDDIQDKAVKLSSPKLELQENAAGQLTFKMPSCNRGYDLIDRITTTFTVYRNDEEIWTGRIINIKEDFYKNKTITCEGILAYLNDTTQPQELYSDIRISTLLDNMLSVHNSKVDKSKRFTVAQFTYDTTSQSTNSYDEVYTNYESTWNAISNKILGVSNGYFTLTKESNYTNPNVLRHYPYTTRTTCPQVIRFGKNLLDFTKDYDATQFCTVILPLGARLDDKYGISMSGIDGVSAYTTIESVNNGSMYYKNDDMVATYGWIEQVVHWDDEENPELLLKKAKEYLEDVQYDVMTLEVKAVDLSYLDVDYSQMKLSQRVRVISEPHNLDKYFPITKISIPLDNPANTTFTMGLETTSTLSARNVKKTSQLKDEIHDSTNLKITKVLEDAMQDASDYISNFTTGYVTITQSSKTSQELYITKQPIPKNYNASNPAITGGINLDGYWRWNYNGLAFVNVTENRARGRADNYGELAITNKGEINANFINTGVLNATLIQAGILKNYYYGKGVGQDTFYLDLEKGILHINATKLTIGGDNLALADDLTTAYDELMDSLAASNEELTNSISNTASDLNQSINTTNTNVTNLTTKIDGTDYAQSVFNKITSSSLWQKLADAGEGVYAGTGTDGKIHYFINASVIKTGIMSADRIIGGNLHLGGYNGYTGQLYLHAPNNGNISGAITHSLTTDGLTSFGTNTNVSYGKNGNLKVTIDSREVTYYLDNSIAYYYKNNNVYGFIGMTTSYKTIIANIGHDIELLSVNSRIDLRSVSSGIDISAENDLYLYGSKGISLYSYDDIKIEAYNSSIIINSATSGSYPVFRLNDRDITLYSRLEFKKETNGEPHNESIKLGIYPVYYGTNNRKSLLSRVDTLYERYTSGYNGGFYDKDGRWVNVQDGFITNVG